MQYALVNGIRREAFPGGYGNCSTCGAVMVAKCGPRVMHHWAHQGRRNCDSWWENETKWHREWKAQFPEECREITHTAPDGEIHRADIRTPSGIYIEVQHSAMSDSERKSRELFYKNLVWVIDGRGFRANFDIYHMLPHPDSEVAQDIAWSKAKRHMNGSNAGLFFRLSEARRQDPTMTKARLNHGYIHGMHRIRGAVEEAYRGHHQYDWVRPRRTWLDAECPVYIDFGEDHLVKLQSYDDSGLPCVFLVSRRKFIHDAMVENNASAIATRFYRIVTSVETAE